MWHGFPLPSGVGTSQGNLYSTLPISREQGIRLSSGRTRCSPHPPLSPALPPSFQGKMSRFGRRQGAGGVQALQLLGMSNLRTLSRQPAPMWGHWSCPDLLGGPSDCRCEASSLMCGVGLRLHQPSLPAHLSIASELRKERPSVIYGPQHTALSSPAPHPREVLCMRGSGVGDVGALVRTRLLEA